MNEAEAALIQLSNSSRDRQALTLVNQRFP